MVLLANFQCDDCRRFSIVAGLVASSGTAKFVTTTSSAIVGIVSAIIYHESIRLLEKIEIDDPVQTV